MAISTIAAGAVAFGAAGPAQAAPPFHNLKQAADLPPIGKIIERAKPAPIPRAPEADASAQPRQAPDGPPVSYAGAPPLESASSARVLRRATSGAYWPGSNTANPNRQVGKLFYWTGSAWNVCSGTAINSSTKSLVITAGHCVFDTINNRWMSSVQFCPGYQFNCPLGIWKAKSLGTTNSWYNATQTRYNWKDDVGMIKVHPDSSRGYLVNYVGGQGVTFNQPGGLYRSAFGYPAPDSRFPQYNWNGEDLVYCQNYGAYDGAGHVNIPCTMTGGASGGSWLNYVNSSWLGYVNGVNSHKVTAPTMGSPLFNNAERDLYDFWKNR
jgi:hypothetical protein